VTTVNFISVSILALFCLVALSACIKQKTERKNCDRQAGAVIAMLLKPIKRLLVKTA
jgi:hypothetical protein